MKNIKKIGIVVGLLAAALIVRSARSVDAQQAPTQLTIAMYAPSAAFKDAAERSAYMQGLAKAVQAKTGIPTTGKAYARYADLKAAKPDFAIIEGQCLAVGQPGPVLATATISGNTSQNWGFFTRGDNFSTLKGKKLVFMETGCKDMDFMDNAMLDGEAKVSAHFAKPIGKPDMAGAVATVRDYKQADAVFAPAGAAKGLTLIFTTGSVANPGFVQMNKNLGAPLVSNVQASVLAYGVNAAIDGWKGATNYAGLSQSFAARAKKPMLTRPEVVGVTDQDILVQPKSTFNQTDIRQHFWKPQP